MNTLARTPSTLSSGNAPGVLGPYMAEIRCEFARTLRNPAIAIPVFVMPVALYLLLAGVIFADGVNKDASLGIYLFGSFAVMGVTMPALYGISAGLALDREMGLLRLKRAQPAPVGAWLVAKIAAGVVFGVVSYLPILAAALLTGKLPLAPPAIAAMSLALIAGAIPFCALGLMVGALVKGAAAPGYANLLYLPGCYLSGMFFPVPKSMHWQVPFWPQFHVEQVAMHAAGVTKFQYIPVQMSIAAMIGFTALFGAITYWRLSHKG
jgi:ABC-2 type transport system permease protein